METCYRHPDRETGVSCSNCGRSICPDCMTPTQVGMRCPECSRQRTKVHTVRSMTTDPTATYVLIAVNVVIFIASRSSGVPFQEGALYGPLVAEGEWWRLVTTGFLHAQGSFGFMHVFFNMYLLYLLGQQLEPALGRERFLALYFTSLLAGSFGSLLLSPLSVVVGASGAVFGLMGATFVLMRRRGIDPMASGIGPMILLNLGITFLVPGIAIGGHLGGLAGGAAAVFILDHLAARGRSVLVPVAACALLGAAAFAGALVVV